MEITHKQALEKPALRQMYLEELVGAGGKPAFVHSYQYVSDEMMRGILRRVGQVILEDQIVPSGTTVNVEYKIGNDSIIYFPEVNFSPSVKILYEAGYPSSDFEIVNETEIMNHETEHAKHFKYGFPDMPLDKFDFGNNLEKQLFLCISEFIAHSTHIKALGLTKPQSDYPKKYQQFLIGFLKGYMNQAAAIFQTRKVNSKLLKYVQKNFSRLEYKAL